MKLILVRHGETVENASGITQGQLPGKLNEKGKEQAFRLGKRLSEENIDKIYCSDLKRTKETAQEILKSVEAPIEYVKELRERGKGVFEGSRNKLFDYIKKNNLDFLTFKPEGGESISEFRQRIVDFYEKIKKRDKGKNILVITHGGFIVGLFFYLENKDDSSFSEYRHENCALSIIEINDNEEHKILSLRCVKHLEES